MATIVTEAHKIGDVKVCKTEEVKVCGACGFDLDESELAADTCSDCGAPLNLKTSVKIWATSVPKAGAKTMGE